MTQAVLFDLDGTLADTSADLIASANACFEGLGHGALLDPVDDQLTAFHGGRAMLRAGLAAHALADRLIARIVPYLAPLPLLRSQTHCQTH